MLPLLQQLSSNNISSSSANIANADKAQHLSTSVDHDQREDQEESTPDPVTSITRPRRKSLSTSASPCSPYNYHGQEDTTACSSDFTADELLSRKKKNKKSTSAQAYLLISGYNRPAPTVATGSRASEKF